MRKWKPRRKYAQKLIYHVLNARLALQIHFLIYYYNYYYKEVIILYYKGETQSPVSFYNFCKVIELDRAKAWNQVFWYYFVLLLL